MLHPMANFVNTTTHSLQKQCIFLRKQLSRKWTIYLPAGPNYPPRQRAKDKVNELEAYVRLLISINYLQVRRFSRCVFICAGSLLQLVCLPAKNLSISVDKRARTSSILTNDRFCLNRCLHDTTNRTNRSLIIF